MSSMSSIPPQSAMEKLARFALGHVEELPVSKRPEIYDAAAACLPEGPLKQASLLAASHIREAETNQLYIVQLLSGAQEHDGHKPAA